MNEWINGCSSSSQPQVWAGKHDLTPPPAPHTQGPGLPTRPVNLFDFLHLHHQGCSPRHPGDTPFSSSSPPSHSVSPLPSSSVLGQLLVPVFLSPPPSCPFIFRMHLLLSHLISARGLLSPRPPPGSQASTSAADPALRLRWGSSLTLCKCPRALEASALQRMLF